MTPASLPPMTSGFSVPAVVEEASLRRIPSGTVPVPTVLPAVSSALTPVMEEKRQVDACWSARPS